MDYLEVDAPDGKVLEVDIPDGTPTSQYQEYANSALAQYKESLPPPFSLPKETVKLALETSSIPKRGIRGLTTIAANVATKHPVELGKFILTKQWTPEFKKIVEDAIEKGADALEPGYDPEGLVNNIASLAADMLDPRLAAAGIVTGGVPYVGPVLRGATEGAIVGGLKDTGEINKVGAGIGAGLGVIFPLATSLTKWGSKFAVPNETGIPSEVLSMHGKKPELLGQIEKGIPKPWNEEIAGAGDVVSMKVKEFEDLISTYKKALVNNPGPTLSKFGNIVKDGKIIVHPGDVDHIAFLRAYQQILTQGGPAAERIIGLLRSGGLGGALDFFLPGPKFLFTAANLARGFSMESPGIQRALAIIKELRVTKLAKEGADVIAKKLPAIGSAIVKKLYSPSTKQFKNVYSDGSEEIVNAK